MRIGPHSYRQTSHWTFSSTTLRIPVLWFVIATSSALVYAQAAASDGSSGADADVQSTEGIQKTWNEFGVWGSISFHSPTLIGKTSDSRFGNIGLRYGRVLAASKTVAFEWTIDAVPVAILSNPRFNVIPSGSGFIVTRTR